MSTKTGKLMHVAAEASEPATTVIRGTEIPSRHYHVVTDKPQDVWVDAAGVPVRFRTMAGDDPIDFVLSPASTAALPASDR
jgi:hypothetical protein